MHEAGCGGIAACLGKLSPLTALEKASEEPSQHSSADTWISALQERGVCPWFACGFCREQRADEDGCDDARLCIIKLAASLSSWDLVNATISWQAGLHSSEVIAKVQVQNVFNSGQNHDFVARGRLAGEGAETCTGRRNAEGTGPCSY